MNYAWPTAEIAVMGGAGKEKYCTRVKPKIRTGPALPKKKQNIQKLSQPL